MSKESYTVVIEGSVAFVLAMKAHELADQIREMEIRSSLVVSPFKNPLVLPDEETRQRSVEDLMSFYHQVIDGAIVDVLIDGGLL